MTDKQPVILPWDDLQELLMYFGTLGQDKAVDMLRGLKPVIVHGLTEEWLSKALRDWWWTGTVEEGLGAITEAILKQADTIDRFSEYELDLNDLHIGEEWIGSWPFASLREVERVIKDKLPGVKIKW